MAPYGSSNSTEAEDALVFLPIAEVIRRVGLSERQVYRMAASGDFPKAFNITQQRRVWVESEVVAWQKARLKEAGRA